MSAARCPATPLFGYVDFPGGNSVLEVRAGDRVPLSGWRVSTRSGRVREVRLMIEGESQALHVRLS